MKDNIIKAWNRAYEQYPSPSATDLVNIAKGINPSLPADEATADRLYDLLCDSLELDAAYDAVYA